MATAGLVATRVTIKCAKVLILTASPYSYLLPGQHKSGTARTDVGQIPSSPTNGMGPASEPRLGPLSISIRGWRCLTTWPISSRPMLCRVCRASYRITPTILENKYTQLTTQPDLSGVAGVINDKFIPFGIFRRDNYIMEFLADQFDSGLQYCSFICGILSSINITSHSFISICIAIPCMVVATFYVANYLKDITRCLQPCNNICIKHCKFKAYSHFNL